MHLEAHHAGESDIVVSILIGVDEPPFAFSLIQARDLSGWNGASQTPEAIQFLIDVRQKLDRVLPTKAPRHEQLPANCPPGTGKRYWFKDIDIGPEMVVVPAGMFMMGSNDHETEGPPHKVTINAPFAVGRFPITFAEWDAAGMPYKPDDEGWGRDRRPVIHVCWQDAKSYAAWLSRRTGKLYRLLSEAEWEYCCRAGTTTKFAFGDDITQYQAHFDGEQTIEVGTFPPNAWGLHDQHGNVWEWCEDNWHNNYEYSRKWVGMARRKRISARSAWWFLGRV